MREIVDTDRVPRFSRYGCGNYQCDLFEEAGKASKTYQWAEMVSSLCRVFLQPWASRAAQQG